MVSTHSRLQPRSSFTKLYLEDTHYMCYVPGGKAGVMLCIESLGMSKTVYVSCDFNKGVDSVIVA
jgi:hypothetical protein